MATTSSSDPGMKSEASGGGETSEAGAAATIRMAAVIGSGNDHKQLMVKYRGLKKSKKERGCTAKERISKMPPCAAGKRSSIYRGVTRHRWTGRYEAHLWDKSTWNQNQNKKGKQVYLGAYDDEEAAARAYDLAALKYWGPGTLINFPVTDYTRDLEEMQSLSREDYLASLRRKSSSFSRGISKSRGNSSARWDSPLGMAGADSYNCMHYVDDATTESEYVRGFCMDRKIDLTAYIRWWGPNKTHQMHSHAKSFEETKQGSEDIGDELKTAEWATEPTEPYQMPCLGASHERKRHGGSSVSAMSILLRSAAYKNLKGKALKKVDLENDENENKNSVDKMNYSKAVAKSSHNSSSEGFRVALGMESGGLSLQRNAYPLAPFLSAPVLTTFNSIDPLTDPILWSSLVPVLPTRASHPVEVTKTETNSDYTFFQPDDSLHT